MLQVLGFVLGFEVGVRRRGEVVCCKASCSSNIVSSSLVRHMALAACLC